MSRCETPVLSYLGPRGYHVWGVLDRRGDPHPWICSTEIDKYWEVSRDCAIVIAASGVFVEGAVLRRPSTSVFSRAFGRLVEAGIDPKEPFWWWAEIVEPA